jgi:hypothetical protein
MLRSEIITGKNDDEYRGPDNCEMTGYDELSEIELLEKEEELARDLWEEGATSDDCRSEEMLLKLTRQVAIHLSGSILFEIVTWDRLGSE